MALTRPPYFDPNTGKMYETSCGNTEGWLTKQSEWLKDWRRRYFILKGGTKLALHSCFDCIVFLSSLSVAIAATPLLAPASSHLTLVSQ